MMATMRLRSSVRGLHAAYSNCSVMMCRRAIVAQRLHDCAMRMPCSDAEVTLRIGSGTLLETEWQANGFYIYFMDFPSAFFQKLAQVCYYPY